jgi:hypothetical protein
MTTVVPTADQGVDPVVGDADVQTIGVGTRVAGGDEPFLAAAWALDVRIGLREGARRQPLGRRNPAVGAVLRGPRFERARRGPGASVVQGRGCSAGDAPAQDGTECDQQDNQRDLRFSHPHLDGWAEEVRMGPDQPFVKPRELSPADRGTTLCRAR